MAALSCWLGLPDRRRTDRLRSWRAVLDLSACGREGGSGHDKPVYASRVGSCDSGRPEDTAAVDGVLHLMGDRVCRMGSSTKHCTEAACHAGSLTADSIVSGTIHAEGAIPATRFDLDRGMKTLPQPWTAAMEATLFTGWIYDHLLPHAAALKVAHPLMLRAIPAAKQKNDQIDANKIAAGLRCKFLPECYMASTEIRERRRTLRYRI